MSKFGIHVMKNSSLQVYNFNTIKSHEKGVLCIYRSYFRFAEFRHIRRKICLHISRQLSTYTIYLFTRYTSVAGPGCLFRIPDPNFAISEHGSEFFHPGSKI
jgi:hypothetical protein